MLCVPSAGHGRGTPRAGTPGWRPASSGVLGGVSLALLCPHVLLCCGSIRLPRREEPPRANRRPRPGALDLLDSSFSPACHRAVAADDRRGRAGHGLPARPIPLGEPPGAAAATQHPYGARDPAVAELLCRARHRGGAWTVGLAGVLAPGLRRVAAALAATTRAARPILTRGAGRPAGFGDERAPCVRLTRGGSAEAPDGRLGCGARLHKPGWPEAPGATRTGDRRAA
jgi:hypothetical protein